MSANIYKHSCNLELRVTSDKFNVHSVSMYIPNNRGVFKKIKWTVEGSLCNRTGFINSIRNCSNFMYAGVSRNV
jgi:hypothetical protein